MKHIAFTAAALLSASAATSAQAANGTITFTGEIINNTCPVSAGETTPVSADYTVNMGKVQASAMNNTGSDRRSRQSLFTIFVGGGDGNGCAGLTEASVHLDARGDTVGAGYLPNLAAAATRAENVGVIVFAESMAKAVDMSVGHSTAFKPISDSVQAQYRFWGAMQGYAQATTAGMVNTHLTYTVNYQ